jgi:UDP:flavonoid glycosyltransferase YjiC (YdhE family)
MRILVTSTSGIGHIHPMVPLATELRMSGHEVVWATAREACPTVEGLGFRSIPAGLDGSARKNMFALRAPSLGETPPRRRRTVAFPLMFGELAAPTMREELASVFEEFRPHLVLHELAELAAAPMATARGIPHITVGFSGALSDELAALVLDSVSPVWALERVTQAHRAFNGDLLLHPFPRSMDTPRSDGPSLPMRPIPFGGTTSDSPPDWVQRFGAERPGIYVTLGTEMARTEPWNAIFEAMADLPVDVVATVGRDLDIAGLESLPSNVRLARFVPQRFLLERASVVVSHAGAGTLMGAAVSGCTQLHIPFTADQWENADILTSTGAGVTIEAQHRDAEVIAKAVERLLTDGAARAAANRVRADFAEMPHPRETVAAIEKLASLGR